MRTERSCFSREELVCRWKAEKLPSKCQAWVGLCCLSSATCPTFSLTDPKRLNHPAPTLSTSQPMPRPLQPIQPAPPAQPSGVPTSGPSQTTIHLLPTGKVAESPSGNDGSCVEHCGYGIMGRTRKILKMILTTFKRMFVILKV